MGKNDGFMIYKRVEDSWIEPSSRIKNFKEFHNHLDDRERREQALRLELFLQKKMEEMF